MGPDRHLVCWEISLGRSERLPSPLPAPAHQMWGEGYILLLCAQQPGCTLLLFFLKQDGTRSVGSHTYQCVDINTLSYGQLKQNFLTSVHLLHLHYDWVLSSTGLRPPAPSAGWWGWGWATAVGRHSSLIGWTPDMEQRFAGAHPSTPDCMVPESKVSKKYSKYYRSACRNWDFWNFLDSLIILCFLLPPYSQPVCTTHKLKLSQVVQSFDKTVRKHISQWHHEDLYNQQGFFKTLWVSL